MIPGAEPYQHMYMTLARGVELRRPVVRVTNAGISAVALASGEVLQMSPMKRAWAGFVTSHLSNNPPQPYYQHYFWLKLGLLWFALIVLLLIGLVAKGAECLVSKLRQGSA